MEFKFFSKNGQLLPIEKAVIQLNNIEYAYGFGVYELLKLRNGIVYFEKQHIDRLFHSASVLNLVHIFDRKEISKFIQDLLTELKVDSANLKIILLGGKTAEDSLIFILPLSPLYPKREYYTQGVKTITYSFQRLFPQAKTLNMLGSFLAYKKAKENGCYDALLLDSNENLTEGTRTNLFVIKDKTLFTQPKEKILEGVTRATVLHLAKKLGYEIEEREITKNQLDKYHGAFLTSTSSKILPVRKIDDFVFSSIPEALKILIQKYDEFLKNSEGIFNPSK